MERLAFRLPGLYPTLAIIVALAAALWPEPALALDHCGQVSSNETWSRDDSPHVVCSAGVTVRNSVLTIEPGASVRLEADANLIVSSGSQLVAVGTQEAGINFFGATNRSEPGFWGQIRFEAGSLPSQLQLARITGGGKGGVPMVDVRGMGTEIAAIILRQSEGLALAFAADAIGPSLDAIGQVTRKEDRCPLLQMSQVGDARIGVYTHQSMDITGDATWHDFCTPYIATVPFDVESEDKTLTIAGLNMPTLTLGPGTTIEFDGDSGLVSGLDEENPGGLFLNGSPIDMVVLTGATKEAGSWNGLTLTPFVSFDNSLFNARVEYGGRGDRAMIEVFDPAGSAIGLEMRHALGYPLAVVAPAVSSMVVGLSNGRGEDPPAIAENGVDRMLVLAKDIEVDVKSGAIWSDIGVPYEIDGDVIVAGKEAITFKLEAGVHLAFVEGAGMQIGHPEHGKAIIRVEGSSGSNQVRLTSLAGTPGSWRGLTISDEVERAELDWLLLENGGSDGPMLMWGNVPGIILHSTFRGALGYPVSVPIEFGTVVLSEELNLDIGARNTLEGNGTDRFLVRANEQFFPLTATWADPGAPVEFDDDVTIASGSVPLIEIHGGLTLALRPGKQLRFGIDAERRAAIRLRTGQAGPALNIIGTDPNAGHGGVVLAEGSTLESDGAGLALSGAAPDAPNLLVSGARARAVLAGLEASGEGGVGIGVRVVEGGSLQASAPRLTGLRIGAHAASGGNLILERGWIHDNSEYGVLNEDPTLCATASLIWWGDPRGPRDESAVDDDCMGAVENASSGNRVSNDVSWTGFAMDDQLSGSGFVVVSSVFLPWSNR